MLLCVMAAAGATPTDLSGSLKWLRAQIQPDGTVALPLHSTAHPTQAQAEVGRTLAVLSGSANVPAELIRQISNPASDDTELLSRAAIALHSVNAAPGNLLATIATHQNADGGFGAVRGEASTLLDTAWAHMAQGKARASGTTARDWLLAQQAVDGGMPGTTRGERIQATALVIEALQGSAFDVRSQNAVLRMLSWLQSARESNGSWSSSSYLTAVSLYAVTVHSADASLQESARQWLLSQRLADGSWNNDALLTALVLRAFAAEPTVGHPPSAIAGQVVDAQSGAAIAGASVELSGGAAQLQLADASGRFKFSPLTEGHYAITVSATGYSSQQRTTTLAQEQSLDMGAIGLTPTAGNTPTTATIEGVVTSQGQGPVQGARVEITGSTTASAVTDATGRYAIRNILPGTVQLLASADGHHDAVATATLAAGQVANFSPALVSTSATPPASQVSRLIGRVTSDSGTPLQGVVVQVDGAAAATTDAAGRFDPVVAAGSHDVRFELAGYLGAQSHVVVPAGNAVDFGDVVLTRARTTSEISGQITDEETSAAIAGAEVSVAGAGHATTDKAGNYVVQGISGTSFDVSVTAAGYLTQHWKVDAATPAAIRKDFSMAAVGRSQVTLSSVAVSTASVGPNSAIAVSASAANQGSSERDVVVQLLVKNGRGEVVDLAPAYAPGTRQLLGAFKLSVGQQQGVAFQWNSGQFAPGQYTLVVRAVQSGTVTHEFPEGQVLATRSAPITITPAAVITGTIAANPPVLRANAGTPVKFSAVIRSVGNVQVPAQQYRLSVVDESNGEVLVSQATAAGVLDPSALATLAFQEWVPSRPGSFVLQIKGEASSTQGEAKGKLYAGDTAVAAYSVNKNVVPTGDQTVRATVKISGEDAATGGLVNPLSIAIKEAIQKSVTYGDLQTTAWTANNKCLGCHVQSQALVGGELSRGLTNHDEGQRNALFNTLALHRQANGALRDDHYPGYEKAQHLLALWALNAWHKKEEIRDTIEAAGTYTSKTQDSDGGWSTDYAGGWWTPRSSQTAFNVKNLVDAATLLEQSPTLPRTVVHPLVDDGALAGAYYMASAPSGALVSSYNAGSVSLIGRDGSRTTLATGLQRPEGLQVGRDGNVYVATVQGIYRFPLSGGVPQLFSTLPAVTGLLIGPNGDMYASRYSHNDIHRISSTGDSTVHLSGAPLDGPAGMAMDEQGRLVVANYRGKKIIRFNADLTYETVVALTFGDPRSIAQQGNGWLVGTVNGLYRFNAEWQGERIGFVQTDGLAVMADGSVFTSDGGNRVFAVQTQQIAVALSVQTFDASAQKGMRWLLVDSNISASSNLELAHRLIGLGSAYSRWGTESEGATVYAKMVEIADLLKSRQRGDGGWGNHPSWDSDSMITAQVGFALDYVNPSPDDPYILNAVHYLLSRQQPDGSWMSENGIFTTRYGATSWVEIWLPVALERVGGIDTDLTLRFAPNVTLSHPTLVPSSTAHLADGSSEYQWKLLGVTTKTRQIDFDLQLKDMAPGEKRAVSSMAQLTFRNSFIKDAVVPKAFDASRTSQGTASGALLNALLKDSVVSNIVVPVVQATAGLAIAVSTDQNSYAAQTPVQITAEVANTSSLAKSGSVALSIIAADNAVVAELGATPFTGLAAGATLPVAATWNTGSYLAGPYRVAARLDESSGHTVDTAIAEFDITSGPAGQSDIAARVRTDKATYQPGASASIVSRVVNRTANRPWSDLTARTTVLNPDGTTRWTVSTPIAALAAGGTRDLTYSLPLAAAPVGTYAVRLQVVNSQATEVAADATSFAVVAPALNALGVQGTVTPDSGTAQIGQMVPVTVTVRNAGTVAIVNGTLNARLLDPATGAVLQTFTQPGIHLGVGASARHSWDWRASGVNGQVVPIAATLEHAGVEHSLALGSVTLMRTVGPAPAPSGASPIPTPWNLWMSLLFLVGAGLYGRRALRIGNGRDAG